MINRAKEGSLCGQAAPYGYDRMLVDEHRVHRQRVHNGEQSLEPRSWTITLVPSDDPVKVETVKWLFKTYAETDIGLRRLADELNSKGIPAPGKNRNSKSGKPKNTSWWIGTIRAILRNEAYVGTFTWGKRQMGKYHNVVGDRVEKRIGGGNKVVHNQRDDWIVKENAFEPLIDRETFDRVQAKLVSRKIQKGSRGRRSSAKRNRGGEYVLTGLLRCGHCGAAMYGQRKSRKKDKREYEYHKYVCKSYHTQGKHVCGHHTIDETRILEFLIDKLRKDVLASGKKDALRNRIREQLQVRQAAKPSQTEALTARLAELDQEVEHGTKRLLRAPDDVADLLAAELSKMRSERDELAREIKNLSREKPVDLEAEVKKTADRLWKLSALIEKAEPERLREIVNQLVSKMDLFNSVSRGDWI